MSGADSHVAIVGAGPSGFYAAEAILAATSQVRITLLERLPLPGGLVRYGVAPDHLSLRKVMSMFERIAQNPRLTFIGNTAVPADIDLDALLTTHHAVILAIGAAQSVDPFPIPPGGNVYSAGEIVGWYNGHPDHANFEPTFGSGRIAILGNGNVAADIARMLLSPPSRLSQTDITHRAFVTLQQEPVREIHLIGRSGPDAARFSPPILSELITLGGVRAAVEEHELTGPLPTLSSQCARENMAILRSALTRDTNSADRVLKFHFTCVISGIVAQNGRVTLEYRKQADPPSEVRSLSVDGVICATGFRVHPILREIGISKGLISNTAGRVRTSSGEFLPRVYAVGWAAHGAQGTIGVWRDESRRLVQALLSDLPRLSTCRADGAIGLLKRLDRLGHPHTGIRDWQTLEHLETEAGKRRGKPREKFRRTLDMLHALGRNPPQIVDLSETH